MHEGGLRGAGHGRGCGLRAAKNFSIFFSELVLAKLPPLILHNLLADRPAPRGAAGGAGGGPPCKRKNTTFKISFKKKATTTGCGSHFENSTRFKILKELLLLQKQTLHQQKAIDLSYYEPAAKGCGIILKA